MRTLLFARWFAALFLTVVVSPAFATVADDLCSPASDPCVVNSTVALTAGSIIDLGGRALHFGSAARVTVGVGAVKISAGPVRLLAGARLTGDPGIGGSHLQTDSSGSIALEATGSPKSRIDMSATSIAGSITLNAATGITVAGDILSDGRDPEADGGLIMLQTTAGDVPVTGALSVKGGSLSGGGDIFVAAGGNIDFSPPVGISAGDFGGGDLAAMADGNVERKSGVWARCVG